MKKKILILIFAIILIPISIHAESCNPEKVIIKAITMKNQSSTSEEITKATIEDRQIHTNVKFQKVGDYILYTVFVQNDSNEEYQFQTDSIAASSDCVEYKVVSEDTIIKPNESKTIDLRVTYKKEVEDNKFENGVFTDSKQMILNLSTDEILTNPETGPSHTIFSLICIALGSMIIIKTVVDEKKLQKAALIAIISSIAVPIAVSAICTCKIEINSTVVIEKENKKICIITGEGACNSRLSGADIQKRLLSREEFLTFLDNTDDPQNPSTQYDFMTNEDIASGLDAPDNNLTYKVNRDQIQDYSKGCYIFSTYGFLC